MVNSFFGHSSIEAAKRHYEDEGYLILREWFQGDTIDRLSEQADELWTQPRNERLVIDFGDGDLANKRMLLRDAPAHGQVVNHKINDLYLESDEFRSILLDSNLTKLLALLLDGPPSICNSLHFTYGSSQRAHFDSWYMPPGVDDKMAVAAVPLEQYTLENGPLFYYPKSHLIPKYRFSDGHIRAIEAEMPQCDAYLFGEIAKRGITKQVFCGGAGDLFIWHSQLLHGGDTIANPTKTRRSVVVHYWRYRDIEHAAEYSWLQGKELPSHGGYYLAREHQKTGKVVDVEAQLAARVRVGNDGHF